MPTGTDEDHFMEQARQEAAQCWCDEDTKHIEMHVTLAEAVARRLANWMRTAAHFSDGSDYYRGLVIRCGKAIGEKAYICDDGTKAYEVLCAKVPEIVEWMVFMDCTRRWQSERICVTDVRFKWYIRLWNKWRCRRWRPLLKKGSGDNENV